jgi:hypothetical protein
LNLPPKQECHQCHCHKSAKYMSAMHKGLCRECAAKADSRN